MKLKITALFMAVVFMLSGCGADKENKTNDTALKNETITADRQSGNDISLYMRPPSTFNPLLNEDETVDMVLKLVYEPLIAVDENFKPYGNLAEGWYFSNEGRTITVKLKSGLKWHSGNSITSDDIAYSINTIMDSDAGSMYKNCVRYIEDVTMIDSLTVNIDFSRAFYGNIYALTFPLISHQAGNAHNVYEASDSMAKLGNGSYDFGSYSASKNLELVKANSCIGKDAVSDRINVVISKDEDTDLYYFTTGITDCIYGEAVDFVGAALPARCAEYSFNTNGYDFIGFNFKNPVLNDKNVRKAVAYCVPKTDILKVIYLSNALLSDTPISPQSWLYDEDSVKHDYDLNKAKSLLDESGWLVNGDNAVREKNGENGKTALSLSILVNSENEQRRQIAKRMAGELMAVGFDIDIIEEDFESYSARVSSGNYDILIGGWELSMDNDLNVLFGNNGNNIIRYNDEAMNGYIKAVYEAVGEGNVKKAYGDLQKYIAEELPYISIAFKKGKLYTGDDIAGGNEAVLSDIYDGVYKWSKR
ncbi:MAG: peptide ABC transporter substrate-binding protein [Firmicutes bacterium]|nr:peptide ABC transporter substrate-binding protein [Bacillota bacterium]